MMMMERPWYNKSCKNIHHPTWDSVKNGKLILDGIARKIFERMMFRRDSCCAGEVKQRTNCQQYQNPQHPHLPPVNSRVTAKIRLPWVAQKLQLWRISRYFWVGWLYCYLSSWVVYGCITDGLRLLSGNHHHYHCLMERIAEQQQESMRL